MVWFDPVKTLIAIKADRKIRVYNRYGEEIQGINEIQINENIGEPTSISFTLSNSSIRLQ
jgi:hypothetical protein